ncbi:MAG: hypothetical protein WDO19_03835 [Bacteroidota bacterium]
MCDFRIWFQQDEDVYVLQCTRCNTFQVRFRKAALLFTVFEYKIFGEVITDTCNDTGFDLKQTHSIPTFNGSMRLIPGNEEIKELDALLEGADTEMMIAQMAAMF